jgi:Ca2+-binding RTX toxin-like protein
MRRTTTLSVAGLLGLALLTPTSSAVAAGETCRGEAATIVGTGPTVTGTEGRDVIVTGTAGQVTTLGGDDLVCVTGGGNSNLATVDAGPGNDVVDTASAPRHFYLTVVLGPGADTLVGGAADDTVTTGPTASDGIDGDRDVVRTGDGDDRVTTGAPYGSTNSDVVDAGSGDDRVTLESWSTAPDGLVTGGSGTDTLLTRAGVAYLEMEVDMAAGVIDGTSSKDYQGDYLTGRFSSFEGLELEVGNETVDYSGTAGDDVLEVEHLRSSCCEDPDLTADLLGGDDQVRVSGELDHRSSVDLGEGHDEIVAAVDDGVLGLDLPSGEMWSGNGGRIPALGIEAAFLMAPRVTMLGDDRDNALSFNACRAIVRGAGGGDQITNVSGDPWWEEHDFGCKAAAKVSGGAGADRIRGGQGPDRLAGDGGRDRLEGRGGADVLLGGRGRDRADGGKGRDRCVAEREKSCER